MHSNRASLAQAVFLALLPYRRHFFQAGGWLRVGGPGSPEWSEFLRENFTEMELEYARRESRLQAEALSSPSSGNRSLANMRSVLIWEDEYPFLLKAVFDPPPALFLSGPPDFLGESSTAIVGTRDPALVTNAAVEEFVSHLARENPGEVVISGFARGVDGQAHRAAIAENLPGIAVLGSGLDSPGPRRNLDIPRLARTRDVPFIFVSEFAPGVSASRWSFPRRNRIIAGLTRRVVIMQAPEKSGALITARYALDEGRDVAAFDHELLRAPGLNEGARRLLADGAEPIALPDLDDRVIREPEFTRTPGPSQLEFWERKSENRLRWLGEKYYEILPEGRRS